MLQRMAMGMLALVLALGLLPRPGWAEPGDPAQMAETIRSTLVEAQLRLNSDPAAAKEAVVAAAAAYGENLAVALSRYDPTAHRRVQGGLSQAAAAVQAGDATGLADARAQVWTGLLAGAYAAVAESLTAGEAEAARTWLRLREFRRVTRLTRPRADATVAVEELLAGQTTPAQAAAAVRADLLDTYQARMQRSLHDLREAAARGFAARRAENAALAAGYFAILAPAFQEARGAETLVKAEEALAALRSAAQSEGSVEAPLGAVEELLSGFRAAPLSPAEQARRAGQLTRFLALVPVEYGRGVMGGRVIKDFEIFEAITFRNGAAAAFSDLEPLLAARDAAATARVAELLATLEQQLAAAGEQTAVAAPDDITVTTQEIEGLLAETMPPDWQRRSVAGDMDTIATLLDQMERAVASGQYEQAESARLEAYAVLETGPEAKLVAFAPQFIPQLENLFWYGQGDHKGLAQLLRDRAPLAAVQGTREQLDAALRQAQETLGSSGSPAAVATNAGVIVFREGLEAVLILASLMGNLQRGQYRSLRRPLWWGVGASLVATVITWLLAQGVLSSLVQYGERLEAVVSLIAVGVLLLITNWFFHKSYWDNWLARFHSQKRRILGGQVGQWVGMGVLGFTSVYREGFETVLFLQALVLDAGPAMVLAGVGVGMLAVLLVGFNVFALHVKLPYKKMLIVTGVMIGSVLLTMVGNTVHAFQVVGWLPTHPVRGLILPYWSGLWFGLFATWEGIGAQVAAAVFVIGSYYLASWLQRRRSWEAQPVPTR